MLPIALAILAVLSTPGCHPHGRLPDPTCTPGAVADGDIAVVCGTRTASRRHVSAATRRAVLAAYGRPSGDFELDHLIPLELGGSNEAANLWPQPAPDFRAKDRLENLLHARVCAGTLPLAQAQRAIAADWTALP
jgi:hypothetical protein